MEVPLLVVNHKNARYLSVNSPELFFGLCRVRVKVRVRNLVLELGLGLRLGLGLGLGLIQ